MRACVCVCVCVRERAGECECECECIRACGGGREGGGAVLHTPRWAHFLSQTKTFLKTLHKGDVSQRPCGCGMCKCWKHRERSHVRLSVRRFYDSCQSTFSGGTTNAGCSAGSSGSCDAPLAAPTGSPTAAHTCEAQRPHGWCQRMALRAHELFALARPLARPGVIFRPCLGHSAAAAAAAEVAASVSLSGSRVVIVHLIVCHGFQTISFSISRGCAVTVR